MPKIYYHGRSKNHTLHVKPGVDHPEARQWHEVDGRPKEFAIHFICNEADVEPNLAHYLVSAGLASFSRIIVPKIEAA